MHRLVHKIIFTDITAINMILEILMRDVMLQRIKAHATQLVSSKSYEIDM